MLRKRRNLIIGIVTILLIAGGGYYFYAQQAALEVAAAQADDDSLQTSAARRGSIIVSALGAGTVISADEITVGFGSGGTLTEVAVRVGQQVETGDILASIDDSDAQEALLNAQLQLAQQNIQVDGSQTQSGVSLNDISVAQAEISLAQAQATLDNLLNWEPDEATIAQAEASLASAQASLDAATNSNAASGNQATVANISINQALRNLETAQVAYDIAYEPARDWELNDSRLGPRLESERESTASRLLAAQESLTIAQANYNSTVSGINDSALVGASTGLLNAQLALDAAFTGPTEDDLEAANISVQQAELSLQQTLLNQENAMLSLEQAKLNVDSAEKALAETVLYAPVGGTIMAVAASVGEAASALLITLADLEQPILEVFIDESDLDSVGLDFEAEVVFDAFPDDTFVGQVYQVDPQLYTVSGISAVRAVVVLGEDSFDKPQTLPIGLNATVEIIGGRANNAVLIPVEALRELDSGQFAVFVIENGEPVLRFVEVGLMDFSFAEITDGILEGEVVSTGLIDTE